MNTIWHLIKMDAFGRGESSRATRDQLGVLATRNDLWRWYSEENTRNPERTLHRLGDLVLTMIGSESAPKLATKAAETKTLTFFCLDELLRYRNKIDCDTTSFLVMCGEALVKLIQSIDATG